MSAPPQTPPTAEPERRFEDFMSDSIGAALKENPKMPAVSEAGEQPEGEVTTTAAPTEPAPPVTQVEPTKEEPGADGAVQEKSPLLPDFSKFAFGEKAAAAVAAATKTEEPTESIPSPEQFPDRLPGKATPQVEQAFQSMRKANKALYEQNATLTTELKTLREKVKEFDGKAPMDRDEFTKLNKERDDLIQELRLSKLEATPEYKKSITQPWEAIEGEIKRLSTKYSLNEHQVRRAITESDPDKQSEMLGAVTETFNDRDKLNLFKIADAAVDVARKRQVLHNDVKQALDYIEAKRNADSEAKAAATKQEWSNSLNKAWDTIGEALYLARPQEGNEAWNNNLNEAKALVAAADWSKLAPVDQAKIMVQAAILPRACAAIAQLWQMYSEANNALKRYQGAKPGAGSGGSGVGTESSGPPVGEELNFIDAVEARMRR